MSSAPDCYDINQFFTNSARSLSKGLRQLKQILTFIFPGFFFLVYNLLEPWLRHLFILNWRGELLLKFHLLIHVLWLLKYLIFLSPPLKLDVGPVIWILLLFLLFFKRSHVAIGIAHADEWFEVAATILRYNFLSDLLFIEQNLWECRPMYLDAP